MESTAPRASTGFLRFGWSPQSFHRLSALATLFMLVFIFAFGNAAFLTLGNGMSVLLQTAVIGLLGIGMTSDHHRRD
jgi:ribose transport system permease protein